MSRSFKFNMTTESKDPGVAQFGNFINYYSFNSAEDRLSLLPNPDSPQESSTDASSIWANAASTPTYVVLDVGCNAGNFTQILHDFLRKHTGKPVHVLGVDIDEGLIGRALQHNKYPKTVAYKCLDMMQPESEAEIQAYLSGLGVDRFDAVFCLSLTMWIHLNHGDLGLEAFLSAVSGLSKLLIIEPQPWKCYLTAVRRMKKANRGFEKFGELKKRQTIEEDIHEYLMDKCRRKRIYRSIPTKWDRKIAIYSKECSQ